MATHTLINFDVDAMQYTVTNITDVLQFSNQLALIQTPGIDMLMLGDVEVLDTEWVVKNKAGHVFKQTNAEFALNYSAIEGEMT
jgi:hypothetical protein